MNIDQHIRTKRKNLAIAVIYSKNVKDITLEPCIVDCLRIYRISEKVIKFFREAMKKLEKMHFKRTRKLFANKLYYQKLI